MLRIVESVHNCCRAIKIFYLALRIPATVYTVFFLNIYISETVLMIVTA